MKTKANTVKLVLVSMLVALLSDLNLNADTRPNILLIMSDDMGFSDIGCYGSEIHTPNLDRMAANGLRYTQFYNGARCCPTRASLLTGLYAHQTGVGHMLGDRGLPGYQNGLNRHSVTIAEALNTSGYRTYMSGKWHVTTHTKPEGPKDNWPLQRGFEKFYGTIIGAGSFFDPHTLCRQNTFITPVNDPEYKPETYYYTDAITDNAVRFLDDHYESSASEPFFMYVSYTAAHWPMHALPEDIEKYEGDYDLGYDFIRERRFERMKQLGILDESTKMSPPAGDWNKAPHKEWEIKMHGSVCRNGGPHGPRDRKNSPVIKGTRGIGQHLDIIPTGQRWMCRRIWQRRKR
jgi:arylsulfatase A-like enzyme